MRRDLESNDIAGAAFLACEHDPPDRDRPSPYEYADDNSSSLSNRVNRVDSPRKVGSSGDVPGGSPLPAAASTSCAAETETGASRHPTSGALPGGAPRSSHPSTLVPTSDAARPARTATEDERSAPSRPSPTAPGATGCAPGSSLRCHDFKDAA
jgi:hypothetical protein